MQPRDGVLSSPSRQANADAARRDLSASVGSAPPTRGRASPSRLMVAANIHDGAVGGRQSLTKLNRDIIRDLDPDAVTLDLPRRRAAGALAVARGLQGYLDGVDAGSIARAIDLIDRNRVGHLFIDGSNLGRLAQAVKRARPSTAVTTFFHNVEARFFLGAVRQAKSPRSVAVFAANYVAERLAVRHSDNLVCLNERDGRLLARIYGRGATRISPMSLKDVYAPGRSRPDTIPDAPYALFVGGIFYANVAGMRWFAAEVAPGIPMRTFVVGKGFEAYRDAFASSPNVEIVGGVDDLGPWYAGANAVIAPIFDGSGMKTKVAEALMFGKKIVGTPEAFVGYEDVIGAVGWQCGEASAFADVLRRLAEEPLPAFDEGLRALYSERYSYEAARARLAAIVGATAGA